MFIHDSNISLSTIKQIFSQKHLPPATKNPENVYQKALEVVADKNYCPFICY